LTTGSGTITPLTAASLYASVAEFKAYARITSTDASDDTVLSDILDGASRLIDAETRHTFYARTDTREYDVPDDGTLYLDDDLLTITTLTNGDAEVLTTSDYYLKPNNEYPKYAIAFKDASTKAWEEDSSGNSEQVISVAGTWGYSATAPTDIKEACLQIASYYYHKRFGEGENTEADVVAGGVVITARDIPASAKAILMNYQRLA